MTFAEYLRRRKTYTEGGQLLRAALKTMPPEVQTQRQVLDYLAETGASLLLQNYVADACKKYRETRRALKP